MIAGTVPAQAPRTAAGDILAERIGQTRSSVVRITDSLGSGSGFFINSDGLVVTAKHVISGNLNAPCITPEPNPNIATRITVYIPFIPIRTEGLQIGVGAAFFVGTVIACDDKHDIAVLKTNPNPFLAAADNSVPFVRSKNVNIGNPLGKPSPVRFNLKQLRDGEPIYTSGYPLANLTLITTSGNTASSQPLDLDEITGRFYDVYLADLQVNPGNSGGPAFSLKNGSLIGMIDQEQLAPVFAKRGDGWIPQGDMAINAGIAIVIPATHIMELLRGKNFAFHPAP